MCEKTSAHPALQKMVLQADEESPIVFVVVVVVYRGKGKKGSIDETTGRQSRIDEYRWV